MIEEMVPEEIRQGISRQEQDNVNFHGIWIKGIWIKE